MEIFHWTAWTAGNVRHRARYGIPNSNDGDMRLLSRFHNTVDRLLILLPVVLSLLMGTPVTAVEVNGATLPERVHRDGGGPELVLNGAGIRVIALFNVYVAAFYLPATSVDGEAILRAHPSSRLYFHLLRNLTVGELKTAITGTLRDTLTPAQALPLESRMQQLDGIFATMHTLKEGSTFVIGYQPGIGTTFQIDGAVKGRIAGADFNAALLRIWIGDRPRDAHLRNALLGIGGTESSASASTAAVRK
jgi:long-chain acyl-CoA synthetase